LLFNPESSYSAHDFVQLQQRVEKADAYVLATYVNRTETDF